MGTKPSMALGVALAYAIAAAPSPAQDRATHACADVARAGERLACYDRAFPPSEAARRAETESAIEDFGLQRTDALAGVDAAAPAVDRIQARVARVEHGANGRRVLTLDNGQAWSLAEATSRGHVREGETVTVRRGALGSHLLLTPAGASLRVRRVR